MCHRLGDDMYNKDWSLLGLDHWYWTRLQAPLVRLVRVQIETRLAETVGVRCDQLEAEVLREVELAVLPVTRLIEQVLTRAVSVSQACQEGGG